jgi:hypothetical protein
MRPLIATATLAMLLAACGDPPAEAPAGGAAPPPIAPPGAGALAPRTPPAAPPPGEQGGASGWRTVASPADASALGRLDQAWRLARAEAEDRGFADQVEALGP